MKTLASCQIVIALGLFIFLQNFALANTKNIDEFDFKTLGFYAETSNLVLHKEDYEIHLVKGYCNSALEDFASKEVVKSYIEHFSNNLPKFINKLDLEINNVNPNWATLRKKIFPINILLSVEDNSDCRPNATAYGNQIYFQVKANSNPSDVFEFIFHEIGHTIDNSLTSLNHIYTESFADSISIVLRDGTPGFMSIGAKEDFDLGTKVYQEAIENGTEAFARKYNIPIGLAKYSIWRNGFRLKCASPDFARDFTKKTPLADIYNSSGQLYVTSCALNSYLFRISSNRNEYRQFLQRYLTIYFKDPKVLQNANVFEFINNITFKQVNLESEGFTKTNLNTANSFGWIIVNDDEYFSFKLEMPENIYSYKNPYTIGGVVNWKINSDSYWRLSASLADYGPTRKYFSPRFSKVENWNCGAELNQIFLKKNDTFIYQIMTIEAGQLKAYTSQISPGLEGCFRYSN